MPHAKNAAKSLPNTPIWKGTVPIGGSTASYILYLFAATSIGRKL
jgi:hypothetical protein